VVSSEGPLSNEGEQLALIFASNHDGMPGSYFHEFSAIRKLSFVLVPLSGIAFVIFCVLKIVLGADNPATISIFTIFPCIFSLIGIFMLFIHFSPSVKHARANSGKSVGMALALYKYFIDNQAFLPNNVKLFFLSAGGENSAHEGTHAFIKSHPEIKNAYVFCIGELETGNFEFVGRDPLRKIKSTEKIINRANEASTEQNVKCTENKTDTVKEKLNSLHGYTGNAFSKAGLDALTFTGRSYQTSALAPSKEELSDLFRVIIRTAEKALEEKTEQVEEN
jgi:hypothetical protein